MFRKNTLGNDFFIENPKMIGKFEHNKNYGWAFTPDYSKMEPDEEGRFLMGILLDCSPKKKNRKKLRIERQKIRQETAKRLGKHTKVSKKIKAKEDN